MGMLRLEVSALSLVLGATSWAQTTERVSVGAGGVQGNWDSYSGSVSADGRYVAFVSRSTNLVPGDTNAVFDVFVRDRQTGVTERVSVDTNGAQGNQASRYVSISADGRYVAFESDATNLVPGDTNGRRDVFVHDRVSGTTERVSGNSSGGSGISSSYHPSISADGRYVAFSNDAADLVPADTNGSEDVFVRDRQTGAIELVSLDSAGVQGNSFSYDPSISADGRYVAFLSFASSLVAGDTNGSMDVFLRDREEGTTERLSVATSGEQANGSCYSPSISADGRCVAFYSYASNLAPTLWGSPDVFVRSLTFDTTERVSVDTTGAEGNQGSYDPSLSWDGRFVAFWSVSDLVPEDSNGGPDIYVRDRLAESTQRMSVSTDGTPGNADNHYPSISADGRYVAFRSNANNLVPGDTNFAPDVFLRDRGPGSAFTSFCFGDRSGTGCPCGNHGIPGHGCENSAGTGGARLTVSGAARLSADTVELVSSGERERALSIVLQGDAAIAPVSFGDGIRCTGGRLKRLYVKNAVGGVVIAPQASDPSITARSAVLGDPISLGATREYQVYYRDPSPSFCIQPAGDEFNISSAIAIAWGG